MPLALAAARTFSAVASLASAAVSNVCEVASIITRACDAAIVALVAVITALRPLYAVLTVPMMVYAFITAHSPPTPIASRSIFSNTGGITVAIPFNAVSNMEPNFAMASRIVGRPSAACVSSMEVMILCTPRAIAAPMLSKLALQLAPASFAAPVRLGNLDVPFVIALFIVLIKPLALISPADMASVTSVAVMPMASAYISMAGTPAFNSISMCSIVTVPLVCILLRASVTLAKVALLPSP